MGFIKYEGDTDKNTMIPFYVTRPDGGGIIYKWSVGMQMSIFLLAIGQLALAIWLIIALVAGLLVAGGAVVDLIGGIL